MSKPKADSADGPMLSDPIPLITEVSVAMMLVSTLGPLSLSSNHPIFIVKIYEYNTYLTLNVTLFPRVPKENFYAKYPTPQTTATIIM